MFNLKRAGVVGPGIVGHILPSFDEKSPHMWHQRHIEAKISVFCVIFPCQITNWTAFISWLCLDARKTRWTSSEPATEKKRQASIITLIISNLFLPSCLALLSFNCIFLILGTMQTWSAAASEKIEQVPDLELYLLLLTPIMDLFSIPHPVWGPLMRPGTLSPRRILQLNVIVDQPFFICSV